MKKYRYFIATMMTTIVLCGMTACNDDVFLEEKTYTSYTYTNAFDVSSQVNDCLTELFYAHKKFRFPDSGANAFVVGLGTDICDYRPTTSDIASDLSNWNPTWGRIGNVFDGYFSLIAKANLVLYGAEHVKWADENEKAMIIAQARFFRGYCYLSLAELFGGVPITESFSESPKFDFTRASREDTYLFAIGEMEAAAAVLPDHQTPGRMGKGAAYHYLAEAHIALATLKNNDAALLDKAIAAADEVMKRHSLMKERFGSRADPASTNVNNGIAAYFPNGDVFFDLFQRGNLDYEEGNTESLWVEQNSWESFDLYGNIGNNVQLVAFIQGTRGAVWQNKWLEPASGSSPWNGGDVPLDIYGYNGSRDAYTGGYGQAQIVPTVYCKNTVWEDCGNDIRNSAENIRRSFPVMATKHSLYGKYLHCDSMVDYLTEATLWWIYPVHTKLTPIDDWGWEGLAKNERRYLTTDVYILRAAETYLLRAEAKLRKGDKPGAAADINEVRGRAKAPLITAADVSLDYILDERIRELYGEEQRWCTLLRMGGTVPNDRISRYSYAFAERPNRYTGTLANDFLFPIPQQVIDSNLDAVIEQNPMWK
jgi:hypothetical protein